MTTETLTATRPISEEIDAMHAIREQIKGLEDKIKELQGVFNAKETALMERLKEEGLDSARGRKASVTIQNVVVGHVENWDETYRYIRRNNAFHLLQRRLADAAYRELLESRNGKPVPGVVPFTKTRISLRTNT